MFAASGCEVVTHFPKCPTWTPSAGTEGQFFALYGTADNDWLRSADKPLRNPICSLAAAEKKQYGAHGVPCADVAWLGSHGALYRVPEKKKLPT